MNDTFYVNEIAKSCILTWSLQKKGCFCTRLSWYFGYGQAEWTYILLSCMNPGSTWKPSGAQE